MCFGKCWYDTNWRVTTYNYCLQCIFKLVHLLNLAFTEEGLSRLGKDIVWLPNNSI